ncbi:MAG: VanW family protein [Clostridia bacterium]|nr:VanW family protein [Clostridia bacterium]
MRKVPVNAKRAQHTAQNSKRKRLRKLLSTLRLSALIGITAFIIILIINTFVARPSKQALAKIVSNGEFFDGITVNGIDVGSMTYDEAKVAVIPAVEKAIQEVGISIVYNNHLWLLTASDLGISADIDAALIKAMLYGRNGNRSENAQSQKALENGVDFSVELTPDRDVFSQSLSAIAEQIATAPVDPSAEPDVWASSPSFIYTEGKPGYSFDSEAIIEQVITALSQGQSVQTIKPELVLTQPTKTLDDVKSATVLRAKYTTEYGSSSTLRETNRIANILKAANLLRGAVIADGEEFSFNEHIGPRTEIGGWPPAPGIVNGNTYELQPGGGICQVSTTLYNALLRCGSEIEITNRKHHSWPSSYVSYGLDATVSTGGPDLAFKNNTGSPLYIFAYADNNSYKMTVYIYGAPLEEGVSYKVYSEIDETLPKPSPKTEERSDWPKGYSEVDYKSREGYIVTVYRQKLLNGEAVEDGLEILYTDKYRAITGLTYVGTGDASLPKP